MAYYDNQIEHFETKITSWLKITDKAPVPQSIIGINAEIDTSVRITSTAKVHLQLVRSSAIPAATPQKGIKILSFGIIYIFEQN
jgi:hypothetical protein